jgi:gas vesicle protein
MMKHMADTEPQRATGHGFLLGVIAGGILGTVLTSYFAPRLTGASRLIADSARRLGDAAAERLQPVATQVADGIGEVSSTTQATAGDGLQAAKS